VSSTLRRAWLLTNIVITVALLPALIPSHHGGPGVAVAAGAGDLSPRTVANVRSVPSTVLVPTTTTTTAAPAPKQKVVAARVVPKTTTTSAKPAPRRAATTAPARPAPARAAPPASGSESGKATWYDYKPGICAHKTLPFGTVVTVHAVNGKSVQCTVGDRGPFVDGYVIDLNSREFSQLAPTSTGRIDCTITW
jgi:rare lipoprotein A (peptidoglycan hydrolase)